MAFDEVRPQTLQASSRSRHSRSVGDRLVATCQVSGNDRKLSRSCTRKPPSVWRRLRSRRDGAGLRSPHVLALFGKARQRGILEGGGDEDVGERAGHYLVGKCPVHRTAQSDDPAESRDPIAVERPLKGRREVVRDRGPARIGVFHYRRRAKPVSVAQAVGPDEFVSKLPGGFGVEQVQIGELPATVLDGVFPPAGRVPRAR